MAAQRHEISLRVLKNISRVSPPFKLFYDEFKVSKNYAAQRHFVFVECYIVNRDYFMVGSLVRFLFTSCEESQTNE